jgi:hypothetical protein
MEELMEPMCVGNTGKWVKTNEVGDGENDNVIVALLLVVILLEVMMVLLLFVVVVLKVIALETVMVGVASWAWATMIDCSNMMNSK